MKLENKDKVFQLIREIEDIEMSISELNEFIEDYDNIYKDEYDLQCATKVVMIPKEIFIKMLQSSIEAYKQKLKDKTDKLEKL